VEHISPELDEEMGAVKAAAESKAKFSKSPMQVYLSNSGDPNEAIVCVCYIWVSSVSASLAVPKVRSLLHFALDTARTLLLNQII
jgi:hypothetical protein